MKCVLICVVWIKWPKDFDGVILQVQAMCGAFMVADQRGWIVWITWNVLENGVGFCGPGRVV